MWGFYEAGRFQDLHAESCVWQWETSICIYIILISLLNHFWAVKHQQFWLTYCNPLCLSPCIPLSASAASSPFYSSSDSTRCHAPLQGKNKQKTIILWLKNLYGFLYLAKYSCFFHSTILPSIINPKMYSHFATTKILHRSYDPCRYIRAN